MKLEMGKIVGFQEGIVDMSGIGATYTPSSQALTVGTNRIVPTIATLYPL